MKTLVTGGAGFIGSHLSDALIERGDEVTIIDDLSSGSRENLASALANGARLVEGDIRDLEFVKATVAEAAPNTIFHLAAQGEVRRSIDEPSFDASVNVVGTVNLLDAGLAIGLDRFVFASTGGAIYGEGSRLELPAAESSELAPLCPYGLSKLAGEKYLELYRRMYMFNSVALRFGNVYGPRQNPKGEAGAVAIFSELLKEGKQPTVFGDGSQTRDFVYIKDVIDAVLTASRTDVEGAINIGTGIETSLLDMIGDLAKQAPNGGGFDPIFAPKKSGEVKRIAIDPARAGRELGWSATTSLDEGLKLTLRSL
ncbi:MAG TPA: NAD-dependent epimerase/dehydratase family protein [Solirubrobacterales bacterium]|nr:NAD-dependent epimerase/dehydratase family protein [Solirubrobacterales bacterium]